MSNVQDKNINKTQTDDFKQCGKIQLIFDQKLQPSKIKMSKKKKKNHVPTDERKTITT